MRPSLLLSLSLLAGPLGAQAPVVEGVYAPETLATAVQLRDTAMQGSGAFAIVVSVTTEVGPRMAGSPGDARAVAWAKAKFEELGYDRVYTEPVTFPAWRRGHERAEVVHHLQRHFAGRSVPGPKPVTDPARERLEGGAGLRHGLEVRHQRGSPQQPNLAHELLARHALRA